MSHSASLADYRAALTTPGARGPVLASLLARLPVAMVGLSLLLYVERTTGSFAAAGLVAAGALVGVATGSVVQGRLYDRFGPTRPLTITVALFAVVVAIEVTAIELRAPVPLLVVLAAMTGLTEPMVSPASRAMWSRLLPAGQARHAAYAYEAISMEVFFILGPGLAGVLMAAPWPGTSLVVAASLMALGGLGFARTATVRSWRPERAERSRGSLLGPLTSPGMRTLAVAAFGFGVTIGFVEVAVPAAARDAGHPGMGGLLLSMWSLSSVVFGVLYGMRPWPRPMHLRLPALLAGFSLLLLLPALPSSLLGLAMALLAVGTLITPQSTAHSATIEQVAPPAMAAEAFGWVVTSVTLGLAAGQSLSGQLVEAHGPSSAFLAAAGSGLVLAVVVWLFRDTVRRGAPKANESATSRNDRTLVAP
ncbi:putative arabinose efflux permease, MFS family [Streptoalloteichus tenebrarius]|uniref:Arabinose efflux permease, MFS family n=1 Tax=Streptoalloteichus tenebrarius (strain ATCC 17920 / DSM 40477 / JCM 4838 / CBS 697.72 / NBRC 16177 / NCIMB 11028 / NRRL B-12390 / A12253. 1 / ISP 5477) TaxID=1933 RepID=A0ABT1HR60_STRSD|nr:MFS transporter [Streptoalloteichus tenebrarius]MCP2258009.1 putative arabinose efflux permease, MFS family [Streptoalloteichus tenebrarius]BFF01677.1 MFS transporter [Streptoalloteichus tenebrarius]